MINIVHNCDCMEFLQGCKPNEFDLAICDIQYGINQGGGKNHSRSKLAMAKYYKDYGDKETMPPEYHKELKRVSKDRILWGANHFIDNLHEPHNASCWIIWDKKNGKTDFADCEIAWTTFNTAIRIFRFQWQGMLQGYSGNKNKNELRIHPNQKPVALYKWLLKNYAKPGWTIFDSHVGSGSLRIACYDMGFDFVGTELDFDYWQAQEERYKNHIAQGSLFDTKEIQRNIFEEGELI